MKKKGSVDLAKFVSIKPSVTVGGRDNLFALEIQGRTYIMQAANSSSKNVWLAKLYETLSGGEHLCLRCVVWCFLVEGGGVSGCDRTDQHCSVLDIYAHLSVLKLSLPSNHRN